MTFDETIKQRWPQLKDASDQELLAFVRNQWGMICAYLKEEDTIRTEAVKTLKTIANNLRQYDEAIKPY